MPKKIFIIVVIVFLYILTPIPVSAHILETDGVIGAVLHIDPEDDPIVGQSTGMFFELKDKQGKFRLKDCDCSLVISEQNKQIYTEKLYQNSDDPNPTASFTFPQKDVYTLQLIGKPAEGSQFQPFALSYVIRVSRDTPAARSKPQTSPIIILLAVCVVLCFILLYGIKKYYSPKEEK